jgi:hypothetical protein
LHFEFVVFEYSKRESEPSNRQLRVALVHALLQLRALVRSPALGAMRDAVAERAAIGRGRARDRAGDGRPAKFQD